LCVDAGPGRASPSRPPSCRTTRRGSGALSLRLPLEELVETAFPTARAAGRTVYPRPVGLPQLPPSSTGPREWARSAGRARDAGCKRRRSRAQQPWVRAPARAPGELAGRIPRPRRAQSAGNPRCPSSDLSQWNRTAHASHQPTHARPSADGRSSSSPVIAVQRVRRPRCCVPCMSMALASQHEGA
jgi:hypothetical protein